MVCKRVLVITVILSITFRNIRSQQCGVDTYSIFQMMLKGHTYKTFKARPNSIDCRMACNADIKCQSYNNVFNEDICELNNRTKEARPEDFIEDSKRYYITKAPIRVPLGSIPQVPGYSCKEIQASEGAQAISGNYWLDLEKNGNPLKVYCDMSTDGGGWLLVSNVVIDSSSPFQLSVETSYRGISNYHNNEMFLTKDAMNELKTHLPFTQIRFHCSKQQVGRTFHVTTATNSTGEAAVQYFSGQTNIQPNACGSFVRMEDDDSFLAGVCHRWGEKNGVYEVGKWGGFDRDQDRLYYNAAFVHGPYHWLLLEDPMRLECDDFEIAVSSGDFWKVFVR